jgi:hypothetical protein
LKTTSTTEANRLIIITTKAEPNFLCCPERRRLTAIRARWAKPPISPFIRNASSSKRDAKLHWYFHNFFFFFFLKLLFDLSINYFSQNGHGNDGDDPDVVQVTLGHNDRRFGFSVVGGLEEGFPPRIDEIAPGKDRRVGWKEGKLQTVISKYEQTWLCEV